MHEATRLEIVKRLKADRELAFKSTGGDVFRGGKCPDCKAKETYIYTSNPWMLRCGRLEKCGHEFPIKERYSDLFDNWSKNHQQTPENPNAAAKAYLQDGRGLNVVKLAGTFSQELYQDWESKATSATVRFPLPCHYAAGSPHNGAPGWWERLIDQPQRFGKKKANFPKGWSYRGHVWFHPALTIEQLARQNEIWIAEGIFNCEALNQAFDLSLPDCRAVSAMSCNNYPEKFLAALADAVNRLAADSGHLGRRPKLVFAFDPGNAGVGFTRKYVTLAREDGWVCRAAQVRADGEGTKLDWNDLSTHGKLTSDDLASYLENGNITIAETAAEKAWLLFRRTRRSSFPLTFKTRQLWANFSAARINELVQGYDEDKTLALLSNEEKWDMAAREAVEVRQIANCTFRALYYQENKLIDQTSYYFRIDFPGKQTSVKAQFPGNTVLKEGPFADRLVSVAPGAIFDGTTPQLKTLMNLQCEDIITVDALYFSGYSIKHGAWMFDEMAVAKGRVIELNDEDYFDIGKVGVKPAGQSGEFKISYDPHKLDYSWWPDFNAAFGDIGTVTLAFWFLSLFAEQIRHDQQRLGFLELWGEGGSGKSTMIMFLWKLCGRLFNYEGFDPSSATVAGTDRELVKYGNLPVVLLEGDRAAEQNHARRFDWNVLKKLYNGHPPRTRGVANGGTETFSPRFIGALVIAQNAPVKETDTPVLERIMAIEVSKARFSPAGHAASKRIERIEVDQVSHWMVAMIRQEAQVMQYYKERFVQHEAALLANPAVSNIRLAFNHAQLAAALDCVGKAMIQNGKAVISPRELEEAHLLVTRMCIERHSFVQSDHPIIGQFWDNFDWLAQKHLGTEKCPELHRDSALIAVNLTQFEQLSAEARLSLPVPMVELKKLLPACKSRKFVRQGSVNCTDGKVRHCWTFQRPEMGIV